MFYCWNPDLFLNSKHFTFEFHCHAFSKQPSVWEYIQTVIQDTISAIQFSKCSWWMQCCATEDLGAHGITHTIVHSSIWMSIMQNGFHLCKQQSIIIPSMFPLGCTFPFFSLFENNGKICLTKLCQICFILYANIPIQYKSKLEYCNGTTSKSFNKCKKVWVYITK